ncbi:MAG: sodium:proton antiporter, partial [Burkholderiaceae bacterium]|nr:sodium:proton antiporter [Burkholderiaceae bacterium]
FWALRHVFAETLFLVGALLAIFYLVDRWYYRREGIEKVDPTPDTPTFGIEGRINVLFLLGIVGLVLMSGTWKPGVSHDIAGTAVGLEQLLRDAGLLVIIGLSLYLTPVRARLQNEFSWAPMIEVAKLFAGIFITITPVLAMLKAGMAGAFAPVVQLVTAPDGQPIPAMYFWASGLLSSFLDNAPTYLVFFNLAGGDPAVLMTTLAPVLAAVSAGSVFMGANSYIGNAPNLMVKAIAEERGVKMPSFFGYMAWSVAVLIPLFGLMTLIWFR